MQNADRSNRTELHYAALGNDLGKARALLAAGANLNAGDSQGFTPLHLAAQEHALEVAKLLVESGADVDVVNRYGNTPLHTAVFNSRGRGSVIELLRSGGADPLHSNGAGQTPLGLARIIANYDVLRFFADLD